jgi:hypothetical protein
VSMLDVEISGEWGARVSSSKRSLFPVNEDEPFNFGLMPGLEFCKIDNTTLLVR